MADLRSDLKLAKFQESQQTAARQQSDSDAANKALADNTAAVRRDYPTIGDGNSPLGKASNAVIAEWNADPAKQSRLLLTNAAQLVAAEAANRTAMDLFNTGKFPTLDLALASLKASVAPTPAAPAPLSSVQPVAQPPARRVAPAPGSRSQATPPQPPTPTDLLGQIGFDPVAANEALYGDRRSTALGSR